MQCKNEHQYAIIDAIESLLQQKYRCYIEHAFFIDATHKIIVDILAIKKEEQIIIEVGTISKSHADRFKLLKQLIPNATILHITQWKNYLSTEQYNAKFEPVDISKMGNALNGKGRKQ